MSNIYQRFYISSLLVLILATSSCFKKKFDFSNVDKSYELAPHIGLPIATGELTLRDIIKQQKDSTYGYDVQYYKGKTSDLDTMIRLVYDIDTIKAVVASEVLKPPHIVPFEKSLKLDSVQVDDQQSDTSITLRALMPNFYRNPPLTDSDYYENNAKLGVVSSLLSKTQDESKKVYYPFSPFGGTNWWIYTLSGKITMSVTNQYAVPVKFTKMYLYSDLSSTGGDSRKEIGVFDFSGSVINAKTGMASVSINVDNIPISNKLYIRFSGLVLNGSTNVDINMLDKLLIDCSLGSLTASAGETAIPLQGMNKDTTVWFDLVTYKGKKITRLDVFKGFLNYKLESTFPSGLTIKVKFPDVKKNGVVVEDSKTISKEGKTVDMWDLSGYSMNFAADPKQPYNRLNVKIHFQLNSNGKPVAFDNSREVKMTFSNDDSLRFEYVEGNFGHDTTRVKETQFEYNVDKFMSDYFKGSVVFAEPKFQVNYENSFGMSGRANLNIIGKTSDGTKKVLVDSTKANLLEQTDAVGVLKKGQLINLDGATDPRVVDFLSVPLPSKLVANGFVYFNDGKSPDFYGNFMSKDSRCKINVHAEIPLKFSMQDFVLKQEFETTTNSTFNTDSIEEMERFGILIYMVNQFPLDMKVRFVMLDTNLQNPVLDTLAVVMMKAAVPGTGSSSVKNEYTTHREEIILTKDKDFKKIDHFLQANKIQAEVIFNTYQNKVVTLYTYYTVKFQIAVDAKFRYRSRFDN